MITKTCAYCSTEFQAQRSNAKYCRQSCRTRASYQRNGYVYRQGHYEKPGETKAQALSKTAPALPEQQGMNGLEAGRAKNDISIGGAAESFIGASVSNFVSHQLTKGEYKVDFAKVDAQLKYAIYLIQNLYKASNIPLPPAPGQLKPGKKKPNKLMV